MKLCLLLVAALVAVALAIEPDLSFYKKGDHEFLTKQAKVLSLFVGLGSDAENRYNHEHIPFPYNDPKYYKNAKALEHFMESYERGLLDLHGVFTFYCHKNRHDTFHLFDLFYYAKDFDTLHDIAVWGRSQLHPIQFFYAYTMAILHREDTRGFYVPPVNEVFPHFFIQSFYMNDAIAYNTFHKEPKVVHEVNNTGWEYSWHHEVTGGIYPTGPKWNGDDYHSRISYFREDAGWSNAFEYWTMRFAPFLTTEKYPDVHYIHRGEFMYQHFKWLLDRYNLERMAYMLPAVSSFETDKPMPGYNSHITDLMGRTFLVRSEGIIPEEATPQVAWEADIAEKRVQTTLDLGFFFMEDEDAGHMVFTTDRSGLDVFSKMIFGVRGELNKNYYSPLYYKLMEAAMDVVKAPNDRDYTTSPLGLTMTQLRDPAFYNMLANIDAWFYDFFKKMPSYKSEELDFPGVKLDKFSVSDLHTYSVRKTFELTNGLPFKHEEDRYKYRSYANQYQLDHDDFEYEFSVTSDKDQDVMIRVFIGPKTDVDGRVLSLNQRRRSYLTLNKYIVKVKAGENVIKKHSFQPELYNKYENFYDVYSSVNKSLETNEPFEYTELNYCGFPYNLQLPHGSKSGMTFSMFVIVTPYSEENVEKKGFYQCHHNKFVDQYSIGYPFDRVIRYPNKFYHDNMKSMDVKVFHSFSKLH